MPSLLKQGFRPVDERTVHGRIINKLAPKLGAYNQQFNLRVAVATAREAAEYYLKYAEFDFPRLPLNPDFYTIAYEPELVISVYEVEHTSRLDERKLDIYSDYNDALNPRFELYIVDSRTENVTRVDLFKHWCSISKRDPLEYFVCSTSRYRSSVVEQLIRNQLVGGSIPPGSTTLAHLNAIRSARESDEKAWQEEMRKAEQSGALWFKLMKEEEAELEALTE